MQVSAQQWQLSAPPGRSRSVARPAQPQPSARKPDVARLELHRDTRPLQGEYLQRHTYTGQTVFSAELDFAVRSALQTYTENASLGVRQGQGELMHIDLYI